LGALCLTAGFGVGWAQGDEVTALRTLLDEGYYALAAQVEGPKLVESFPGSAEAHYLYAYALHLTGNTSRAAAEVERAKRLGNEPEIAHLDALLRADRGDAAGAARLLARTFSRSPSYDVAMDWGRVAWQGGDLKQAVRAFREAAGTPRGRNEPWPSLNLARLLALQERYREAIVELERTLDILERDPAPLPSPAYVEAFYRLGAAHEALGELEEAVPNYQAARSADPDYAPATDALTRLGDRTP